MKIKLVGSAGTGEKILENWEMFGYKLNAAEYEKNCKNDLPHVYPFEIKFGTQEGYMSIAIEDGVVSSSTIIDCSFDRPLGAYNDTTDFNGGLYKVAKNMLDDYNIKI